MRLTADMQINLKLSFMFISLEIDCSYTVNKHEHICIAELNRLADYIEIVDLQIYRYIEIVGVLEQSRNISYKF